jgi:Collagen triple helix repeat (20 copies)/Divergent InlB B-repeat domain
MNIRRIVITGAAALALVAGGTAAGATLAGPVGGDGTIHGCYDSGGNLKVIDASASCPKTYTALNWSQTGLRGATGPQGPKGDTGAQGQPGKDGAPGPAGPVGPAGADGHTVLNGTGAPDNSIGSNGDFYIDTAASVLYGPKAGGSWPTAGTSLTGPAGPQGPPGPAGSGGSLDSMIGSPCNQGTEFAGTLSVDYAPQPNGTSKVTITCQQTSPHYGLTVTFDQGNGLSPAHGRVTSQPGTVDCTDSSSSFSPCLGIFTQGTIVTLTAAPLAGHFNFWSGCDSTSGQTCTVTINSAESVTAHFSTS